MPPFGAHVASFKDNAMILFMWGLIFVVALIPGAIVGWLVGKIPFPAGVCGVLLVTGSAVLGFAASKMTAPNQSTKFGDVAWVMDLPRKKEGRVKPSRLTDLIDQGSYRYIAASAKYQARRPSVGE